MFPRARLAAAGTDPRPLRRVPGETNGIAVPGGRGLLSALADHGIPAITTDEKEDMRALVMRGGPWTTTERRRILDYCQTDVDVLGAAARADAAAHPAPGGRGLGHALLRGRYMAAVAGWTHWHPDRHRAA